MAELTFYYGAMGCSKTANALMTRFQHIERGRNVWLIKPNTDTRDDIRLEGNTIRRLVRSRVGIEAWTDVIHLEDKIVPPENTDIIICDEAQFFTPSQIEDLKNISETLNIPVICYGLRTDFQSNLFSGSKRLFELASKIIELDTVCECGNKAIISARLVNGTVVTEGNVVDIGGDEKYKAMCYSCWKKLRDSGDT